MGRNLTGWGRRLRGEHGSTNAGQTPTNTPKVSACHTQGQTQEKDRVQLQDQGRRLGKQERPRECEATLTRRSGSDAHRTRQGTASLTTTPQAAPAGQKQRARGIVRRPSTPKGLRAGAGRCRRGATRRGATRRGPARQRPSGPRGGINAGTPQGAASSEQWTLEREPERESRSRSP